MYMFSFELAQCLLLDLGLEGGFFISSLVCGGEGEQGPEGVGVALEVGDGVRVVVRGEPGVDVQPVFGLEQLLARGGGREDGGGRPGLAEVWVHGVD